MPPLSDFIAGIDLPQLVEHYAGPGKHSGGSYLFKCPNPDHYDGHPSFSVFTGKGGAWRCHCLSQCGHVGDALDFLAWQLRCDKSDALRTLRTWAGQPTALPYATQAKKVSKQVAQVKTDPGCTEVNDLAAMSDYLTARQLLGTRLGNEVSNSQVKCCDNNALRSGLKLAVKHGPPLALGEVLRCVHGTPGRFNFIASLGAPLLHSARRA